MLIQKKKSSLPQNASGLAVRREKGNIWSHLRNMWLVETPEETVRQEYLCVLVNEYGYGIDQMEEERDVTGRGSGNARADFIIWRSAKDKADGRTPLIIVECKSDNVTIRPDDYGQGDNYARLAGASFFVTHNSRETKYWRVVHDRMPKTLEEIGNVPHAGAGDKEIEELIATLKTFKEDEFARLLHDCHNVIRNREKLDPAAAFDEIAKILFVKVYVERELRTKRQRKNLFSVEYLDDQLGSHPLNDLFKKTREAYEEDRIFEDDEEIRLRPATGREIVRLLERYNLSDTSEDIKGIAFERFLGRTFRGEIGQFFTPRTIVEFMIRMMEPKEGDVLCDPASGSGGFLIRFFEIVREQIMASADAEYQAFKTALGKTKLSELRKAAALREKFAEIQETLDPRRRDSRLWNLANRCVFGTDANDRMARTSKMNMIMHGDGHCGVHHHDGFLNVNGIFEGRFDMILTNPPFGANVEPSDVVHEPDIAARPDDEKRYREEYGALYSEAISRVRAAVNKPIASLFELPKGKAGQIKTEILFIERCLALLKPGGRLGIVLPEGILNNPSLRYVREFCEGRAFIKAVVSLPEETFLSSGTTVKTSLVFLQKFTVKEKARFEAARSEILESSAARNAAGIARETKRLQAAIEEAEVVRDDAEVKRLQKALADHQRKAQESIAAEAKATLRDRMKYPIFLYEARHVGINAVGEKDQNELWIPDGGSLPTGVGETCLEKYRRFKVDPQSVPPFAERIVGVHPFARGFHAFFCDMAQRWDAESFCVLNWKWNHAEMDTIGSVLIARKEKVDRTKVDFAKLQPLTIHFDGSVDKRIVPEGRNYSMDLYYARPGDLVVAKIDLKNGAVGIVPSDWENVVVTGHFAVYKIESTRIRASWLHRIIQQPDFKQYLWRNKVGAEGRKEVKLEFFESIKIPVPSLDIQDSILSTKESVVSEIKRLQESLREKEIEVDAMIHGAKLPGR